MTQSEESFQQYLLRLGFEISEPEVSELSRDFKLEIPGINNLSPKQRLSIEEARHQVSQYGRQQVEHEYCQVCLFNQSLLIKEREDTDYKIYLSEIKPLKDEEAKEKLIDEYVKKHIIQYLNSRS